MTLLSVTELRLGGAITANLYKPLAQKDDHRVSVLMEIYRQLYLGIVFLILLVGGGYHSFCKRSSRWSVFIYKSFY